jgi:hypothetical protein
VALAGAAGAVPLGHGRGHLRRLLTALALYDPAAPPPAAGPAEPGAGRLLREIRIALH